MTGIDKKVEAWALDRFDLTKIENTLLVPFISSSDTPMNTPTP